MKFLRPFLLYVIICSCFLSANLSHAQKSGDMSVAFESSSSANFKNNPTALELATDIGVYAFDWLAVSTRGEIVFMPLGRNGGDNYMRTETVGGGLLFDLWKTGYGTLQVNFFSGSTVRNSDWKYIYYSGGVYFNMKYAWVRPVVGMGVKYYDAHRGNDFDNQTKVFFSLGFIVF